ncbi:MAG TPA: ABC transporter permease [Bauldia sp.]|nr:ABC transporter permease [Bauldia sp.]
MTAIDTVGPAGEKGEWQGVVAVVAVAAALLLPLTVLDGHQTWFLGRDTGTILAGLFLAFGALAGLDRSRSGVGGLLILVAAAIAVWGVVTTLPAVAAMARSNEATTRELMVATAGFWALVVAAWALAWLLVNRLSDARANRPVGNVLLRVVIPVVFGAAVLLLWEVIVRGFAVPFVVMPPPSAVWARITTSIPTLWADFQQTFLKAVLVGYAIGCGSGFVVAILVDRVPFLRRGLLPIGNLVSALPIVAIAPIMVMWFGFDWPSKSAVVVAMTFFPMLVNTLAGLAASDQIERDLMHTYAASYWQALLRLRLPAALPFIFNALKINSTLAMIGAIVAEFFGTPVVGMGFRISTEVGRMNTDMVWAEIAVAAVAGSAFYGIVALIERAVTFWHPSFRQS